MFSLAVVLAGTNGEAVTLSADEKKELVRLTREVAVQAGRPDLPITMGCGGQCTRDVIAETRLAAEAGADFALVLTPSYFHFAMTLDAIVAFFQEVRKEGREETALFDISIISIFRYFDM